MRQPKMIGLLTTSSSSWSFTVQRTGGGGPYSVRTITVPDGSYYLADDGGADDLVDVIEDLVHVHAELASFVFVLTSGGVASMVLGSGITATLTWTTAGEALRDLLRYAGATASLTDVALHGARVCGYCHYPTWGLTLDDRSRTPLGRQVRSQSGRIEGDDWGTHEDLTIRWKYQGPHRSADWNEYLELEDFYEDVIAPSLPFRLYPDRSVVTAFDRHTAPFGYEVWTALGPPEWRPQRVIQGVSVAYDAEWSLAKYV